jgi:hypothetical protein
LEQASPIVRVCCVDSVDTIIDIVVNRLPVNSSELASIGFDAASRILEVEFRSGGIYQYSGVSQSVYSQLMSAQSHGFFFNEYVKKAGYPYVRVG